MSQPWPAPDGWNETLLDQVIEQLAAEGHPFTADHVRDPRFGLDPAAARHGDLGAAFRRARARGLVEVVGYRTSTHRPRHGGLIRVWVGVKDAA